jgi:hypothetical protein
MRSPGSVTGPVLAASPLPSPVVVIGIGVVVLLILLAIPVLFDSLMEVAGKQARRSAKRTLFLGVIILLAGLAFQVRLLELVGGGLMGVVVLAAILDNY